MQKYNADGYESEAWLELRLRKAVEKAGGQAFKWVSGHVGVPDRIVFLPKGKVYFLELKAEKGVVSAIQAKRIRQITTLGQDARVLRGLTEIDNFIENEVKK